MVLFVPGFFGFGSFGHPDRPLIEYFARVEDALLRAHLRPLRFAVHQPPPAGSIAERVRSLHARVTELIAAGATRLHLVGHSTGGLDVRLLAHPRYSALPERAELIARIGSVFGCTHMSVWQPVRNMTEVPASSASRKPLARGPRNS